MNFKVGDRVIATSLDSQDTRVRGKMGTVVEVSPRPYGVEFDDFTRGHDCRGLTRAGHGWYMEEDGLQRVITGTDELVQHGVQVDENVNDNTTPLQFPDLSKWVRLTPKDWKERYKEYEGKIGYFVESFNLYDVDKIILRLCRIEDAIEQAREQFKGGQNG